MRGPSLPSVAAGGRLFLLLGGTVVGLAVLSMLVGPAGFGLPRGEGAAALILTEIRLPRTLLAILTGAALALSGAALQGYLRNPLAEPGIIGISSGAGLGAVLAIHTGASSMLALALPLGGLAGAALATLIVLTLAGERGGALTLILAGVAVSSVATALISLALSLAPNPFAAVEIVFWLLGSLADRSMTHVWLAGPLMLAGMLVLLRLGSRLDALTLGEDAAHNLGIDLARLRHMVVAGTALAVGAATAIVGTIAFVGLVVPHVLRPLVGHTPSRLLPASLLGGAALVLASDIALRILTPGGELRLGVLTALMGAPFFLWLVLKLRAELV
ncbi:MAG TPA: iron ABC transporter permease [Candidatus Limnocylindrales bacterium]